VGSLWSGVYADAAAARFAAEGKLPVPFDLIHVNCYEVPIVHVDSSPKDLLTQERPWDRVREWMHASMLPPLLDGANAVLLPGWGSITVARNLYELRARIYAIERASWRLMAGAPTVPDVWLELMDPKA